MGSYAKVLWEVYVDDYGKARWVATATDPNSDPADPIAIAEGRGHSMEEAALDLHRTLEKRGSHT
jgi:hypothetical protein